MIIDPRGASALHSINPAKVTQRGRNCQEDRHPATRYSTWSLGTCCRLRAARIATSVGATLLRVGTAHSGRGDAGNVRIVSLVAAATRLSSAAGAPRPLSVAARQWSAEDDPCAQICGHLKALQLGLRFGNRQAPNITVNAAAAQRTVAADDWSLLGSISCRRRRQE